MQKVFHCVDLQLAIFANSAQVKICKQKNMRGCVLTFLFIVMSFQYYLLYLSTEIHFDKMIAKHLLVEVTINRELLLFGSIFYVFIWIHGIRLILKGQIPLCQNDSLLIHLISNHRETRNFTVHSGFLLPGSNQSMVHWLPSIWSRLVFQLFS